MCKELKDELDAGTKTAHALVAHLERMGAGAMTLAVNFKGTDYVVNVQPKDMQIDLPCPGCMANLRLVGGELMYVSSGDPGDPSKSKEKGYASE